jgi:hypothetical protein
MANQLTGGCLCGAVRYECSAKPLMSGNCHCRDCQKSSGGAFVAVMVVRASTLKIEGQVKYYESKADSGNSFTRGFCPECGARLFGKSTGDPRLAMVAAASLDDPSQFQPTLDFFTSSAQAWDHMNPKLTKFPKQPF